MNDILETLTRWLGLEAGYAPTYIGLRGGMPLWALGAGVCGSAALAAVLYAIEPVITRTSRVALAILRTSVFSLVVCFLFAPVVGVERSRTVRPNVIVMVDRSESMAIADPRSRPGEQLEAALALGAVRFPMAHEQQALARARRAAAACAASIKQNLWREALAADGEAREALEAAVARPAGDGETPESVASGIRELVRLQNEVRDAVEECLASPVQAPERAAGIRQREDAIRRQIEALEGDLAAAPVAPGAKSDGAPATRARMARGLLARPELDRLAEVSDVHVFSFGERLEDIGNAGTGFGVPADALEPTARATFGARAIREAVSSFSSDPVASVVMLTDGAFNDENMPALGVAGWLREQGVPLVVTGLGLQSPTDVGLRSLIVPDVMFPKDLITARLQVVAHGYGGEKTPITALLDGVEVAKRSVELSDDPQFVELTFRVPEGKGGQHRLTFEVPARPGEVSLKTIASRNPPASSTRRSRCCSWRDGRAGSIDTSASCCSATPGSTSSF